MHEFEDLQHRILSYTITGTEYTSEYFFLFDGNGATITGSFAVQGMPILVYFYTCAGHFVPFETRLMTQLAFDTEQNGYVVDALGLPETYAIIQAPHRANRTDGTPIFYFDATATFFMGDWIYLTFWLVLASAIAASIIPACCFACLVYCKNSSPSYTRIQ